AALPLPVLLFFAAISSNPLTGKNRAGRYALPASIGFLTNYITRGNEGKSGGRRIFANSGGKRGYATVRSRSGKSINFRSGQTEDNTIGSAWNMKPQFPPIFSRSPQSPRRARSRAPMKRPRFRSSYRADLRLEKIFARAQIFRMSVTPSTLAHDRVCRLC